jgi:hypothetical protein
MTFLMVQSKFTSLVVVLYIYIQEIAPVTI